MTDSERDRQRDTVRARKRQWHTDSERDREIEQERDNDRQWERDRMRETMTDSERDWDRVRERQWQGDRQREKEKENAKESQHTGCFFKPLWMDQCHFIDGAIQRKRWLRQTTATITAEGQKLGQKQTSAWFHRVYRKHLKRVWPNSTVVVSWSENVKN